MRPVEGQTYQETDITLTEEYFPYFLKGRSLSFTNGNNVSVLIRKKDGTTTFNGGVLFARASASNLESLSPTVIQAGGDNASFQLPYASLNASGAIIDTWKLRFVPQFAPLAAEFNASEIADISLIFNYQIDGVFNQPLTNPLF